MPSPRDAPSTWTGRQVALISGQNCVAFGEALQLHSNILRANLCGDPRLAQTLLVRDAVRHANGLLSTAEPFRDNVVFSPPPDMSGAREAQGRQAGAVNNPSPARSASAMARSHRELSYARISPEPRPVARIGSVKSSADQGLRATAEIVARRRR
jgi:hypothetical protein